MTTISMRLDGEAAGPVETERTDTRQRVFSFPANTGLILAVGLAVAGFGLIAITWWKVSDLTNLAQQLPYFVSGGLTGLGLVVLSAAVLVVVTRRPDEQERQNQARALIAALNKLAANNDEDAR